MRFFTQIIYALITLATSFLAATPSSEYFRCKQGAGTWDISTSGVVEYHYNGSFLNQIRYYDKNNHLYSIQNRTLNTIEKIDSVRIYDPLNPSSPRFAYDFFYNSSDLLAKISSYRLPDQYPSHQLLRHYNLQGQLYRLESRIGSLGKLHKYTDLYYTPYNQLSQKIYYNSFGQVTHSKAYTYDSWGRLSSTRLFYADGNLRSFTHIKYNSRGKVAEISHNDHLGTCLYLKSYIYDNLGYLVQENIYNSYGTLFYSVNYWYNDINQIDSIVISSKTINIRGYAEFIYNRNNQVCKMVYSSSIFPEILLKILEDYFYFVYPGKFL